MDRKGNRYEHFFTDGNLLAVGWGLADKEQARRILGFIRKNNLEEIPVKVCFSRQQWWGEIFTRVIFPFYNVENIWAFWGPWLIIGKLAIGDKKGTWRDIERLAEIIVRNGTVAEVVDKGGKMVDTFVYKTERQIAWGAGMFVYAIRGLEDW